MEEDFFDDELISRFEEMLDENQVVYFDVEEFEELIFYYLDLLDFNYANKALFLAKNQHPFSIEIKIKEIEVLLAYEDLNTVSILIEQLKSLEETYIELFAVQGKYWSLVGNSIKSIYFYKKGLEKEKENAIDFYINIAEEYLTLKESAKALYYFEKALEIDSEDEYLLYCCIACFDEVYLYEACIYFLEQFIEKNPYNEKAWFEVGLKYVKVFNYDKALEAFDYAILIDENFLSAYKEKVKVFEKLQKYQEAIKVYKEFSALDQDNYLNYYKIGLCYKKMKMDSQAFEFFQLAIKGDPSLDKAFFGMAIICEKSKNYKEAIDYLLGALSLDKENSMYWKKLIDWNLKLKYYKKVVLFYKEALNLDPNDDKLWLDYIEFLIDKGEYKEAIHVLTKDKSRFEKKPGLYYYTACCYFLIKKEKKGFLELSKALKQAPSLFKMMINKYPNVLKNKLVKKKFFCPYII